jgi:hypothetical protein
MAQPGQILEAEQNPYAVCIVGLMRLIEILSTFSAAFPINPEQPPVAAMLGEIFRWWLDLHNSQIREKFDQLAESFWGLCGFVFRYHDVTPLSANIYWSEEKSRSNVTALKQNWMHWTNPENIKGGPATPGSTGGKPSGGTAASASRSAASATDAAATAFGAAASAASA